MASHVIGNRNSTPEASKSSLRPPSSRALGGGSHQLRASADMSSFASPLSTRSIRPSSEVFYNQQSQPQNTDDIDKAAQQWIADIDQYETTLEEMAAATLDQDFKDELSAIEQWFRVLSEAERTAALYALLQQTTQVQIRFFIQVLQQMSKSHPMSSVLSPANFGEKDPMNSRLTDAMSKLNVEGSRNSFGRPPLSPGNKRNSGLDSSTINAMFPDAAAAIAKQRAEFTQQTGAAPTATRNSAAFGERSSLNAPTISAPDSAMKLAALSTVNNRIALDDARKYRRARSNDGQGKNLNINQQPLSPGIPKNNLPATNLIMVNDVGQILNAQQIAALQAQQQAAMSGRRSRPNSPGIAMQGGGMGHMNFASPQNNGFLAAYDTNALLNNGFGGLNVAQFSGNHEGYLSDHSEIARGRSPRGRRGSSKPPEDPTDPHLLQDIPSWLRSLRLHKYTENLKDLKWTELIELNDKGLEERGVNALGARNKMLKVFEQVKEARAEGKLNAAL
ncbi:conserved hypothetical protein [Histoplasma mississippiense (nom. inval.)]|uniref:conserved hypothetical protein n=1 Tax=Ajellomyces capsulatus (strain NAm1 / WU24) TaxID=2059318 RepID=UPI000157C65B|nr:conserved hypothetical protein [Histoplasma mississippiense (nom. inval.)]EDN08338.1 conserved hypothetical protein [Histoplasma mississippiense (nom. inval.)]